MAELKFKIEHFIIAGHHLTIRSLLDQNQFDDPSLEAEHLGISSSQWPFFGLVWPSSLILAELMAVQNTTNLKILEIGCGVGLAGIISNKLNADITMSDYHPSAEKFLLHNLDLNGLGPVKFERIDWSKENSQLGQFDLIIGSDILYDRLHPDTLIQFFEKHLTQEGHAILIDPARGEFPYFLKALKKSGYYYTSIPQYTDTALKKNSRFNILRFSHTLAAII